MILVDTSVWVDYLRGALPSLGRLLGEGEVLMHPFVLGELECGNLGDRERTLRLLASLPRAAKATDDEVLVLIERSALMGRGLGWVDTHLLASTRLEAGAMLWTSDRRLADAAVEMGVAAPF